MVRVLQIDAFADWLDRLRDREARLRIGRRLRNVERGMIGDAKGLGGGLGEIRIPYGPDYRLY